MINATLPINITNLPQPLPATLTDLPFNRLLSPVPPQLATDMIEESQRLEPEKSALESSDLADSDSSWLSLLGLNPATTGVESGSPAAPIKVPSATQVDTQAAVELVAPGEAVPVQEPVFISPGPSTVLAPDLPGTEATALAAGSSDEGENDLAPTELAGSASAIDAMAIAIAFDTKLVGTSTPATPVPQSSVGNVAGKGNNGSIDARLSGPAAAIVASTVTVSSKPPVSQAEADRRTSGDREAAVAVEELAVGSRASTGTVGISTTATDLAAPDSGIAANNNAVAPPAPAAIARPDPVAALAERQLDLARDTRWIDELARDIVAASGRSDRLSFTLVPPQLGQLNVDISQSDQGLAVRMNSETETTTQIVTAAQPRLVEELKSQGIRVASTEVATGSGQPGGSGQQQNHHSRNDARPFEFAWPHFDRSETDPAQRPTGRFA